MTYDGYRAGELPRRVIISGKEYAVGGVLESSRVRRADGAGDEEHYKVRLDGFGEAGIVYHHSWDGWTLKEKRAAKPFSVEFVERLGRP